MVFLFMQRTQANARTKTREHECEDTAMPNNQQGLVGKLPAGGQEAIENRLTQVLVALSARKANIFLSLNPLLNDAVMQCPVCFRGRLVF